jgi:hypothetical protein
MCRFFREIVINNDNNYNDDNNSDTNNDNNHDNDDTHWPTTNTVAKGQAIETKTNQT